ncbi:MAG: histidine kinase, partial [Actinomycetota bacterium]|nr:histidine kinase [Actinomycetota bacterium]
GLRYVGQVGTGFTDGARRDLPGRLTGLERRNSPFVDQVPREAARHARWVDPELLGEVSYRQWTPHGRLGQATWRGLRPGRHPAAVQAPVLLGAPGPRGGADERELAELDQAVRRARAEVDTLRAQISPHFLYNALSAIAAFVRTDPTRARELLIEFADFTRYSFRSGVELSTLADELDTVERYLTLEQARLGDRLRVELQVAPEVLRVVVPFLAVQLVVESVVRHGVEDKPGGGTVTVWAGEAGADCLVTVTDDGSGPDPERSSGLRVVDDRLRSAFGEGYRLVVDAAPGGGTRVSFRLPGSR